MAIVRPQATPGGVNNVGASPFAYSVQALSAGSVAVSLGSQALDPRHAIASAVGHPQQSHITNQWAKQNISCRTSPLGPLHALSPVHDIVGRRPDLGSRRKLTPIGARRRRATHLTRSPTQSRLWAVHDDRWKGRGFRPHQSSCVRPFFQGRCWCLLSPTPSPPDH